MGKRFSRFSEATPQETSTIDIAPLIDCVFILLIFFIVTSVFVEETGIDVEKPRAASQKDLEQNSILIGITPEGRVFHGGREIGTGSVRAVVSRLRESGEELPVIIQADRRTPTETTIEVLDEAKLAGAQKVFVSTVGGN